jgi:large subunit ribosomal protein L10
LRQRLILLKGGEVELAVTKQQKEEMLAQYLEWLAQSKSAVLTEYIGLNSKEIENLRIKIRETGGEMHVVKNTLGKMAFKEAGYEIPDEIFTSSTAVSFAFENPAELAKAITDFAKQSEFVKVKAGTLGARAINADGVKALAELPPLPVIQAQLLGLLQTPATRLARVLAEPGRQIAAAIKAYAEKDSVAVEA